MAGMEDMIRRWHGILGCCVVLGVCLMLCVPLMVGMGSVDATGSGTIDDPYRDSCDVTDPPRDIYIVVGTEVNISSDSKYGFIEFYMDYGSGLAFNMTKVEAIGTASTVGDYNYYGSDGRNSTVIMTIHIIEDTPTTELRFLSDPVMDGMISYGF